mmetsp:Transcript_8113/g.11821  ORF Transcript_8113/g.11821 Transcript_8113/m.11821 type:complete len:155 (+) Transcript_8113:2814-3278(+)
MLGSESCDQPLQTNPTSAPSSKPSVAPRGNVGNSRMGMVGLGSLSSSKVGSSAHHMESTATSKAQDSRTSPTATLKVEEGRQKASHVHGAPTQMLPKLQKLPNEGSEAEKRIRTGRTAPTKALHQATVAQVEGQIQCSPWHLLHCTSYDITRSP